MKVKKLRDWKGLEHGQHPCSFQDLTGQKKNVSVRGMVTLWVPKYKNCLCLFPVRIPVYKFGLRGGNAKSVA